MIGLAISVKTQGGGGQRQSEGKAAELVGFDLPYESC